MSGRPDLMGREVVFHFQNNPPLRGTVMYTPCAPGDCWHLKREPDDLGNGGEWLIQQFECIEIKQPHTALQEDGRDALGRYG